ncbi:hypothetical protein ACOSP7_003880 [Xanthoceras sorbifolium]|uniref:Calcium-transporting P-type ATPase N-terminal autoinhibitory domain-containing protein n=1 Tax=Xanthoceras sorbifolium TaxID=99658 RepID=A0ABQ8IH89_9ROSI|nr:hypothetical protein JRO89_XS02G0280500 [Xanthoceras sorbifolium]
MESYLNENFGGQYKSEEVLGRWRKLCGVVKNPKRRFRFTANLSNGGGGDGGGGDDENNGGGHGRTGNGNGNGSDKNKGGGGGSGSDDGKMKGNRMDFMGGPIFGYKYGYHAGNENGHPVGQLQCAQAA